MLNLEGAGIIIMVYLLTSLVGLFRESLRPEKKMHSDLESVWVMCEDTFFCHYAFTSDKWGSSLRPAKICKTNDAKLNHFIIINK